MAALLSDENWECVALRMALIDSRRLSPLIIVPRTASVVYSIPTFHRTIFDREDYIQFHHGGLSATIRRFSPLAATAKKYR
jgi:hypothetical protein